MESAVYTQYEIYRKNKEDINLHIQDIVGVRRSREGALWAVSGRSRWRYGSLKWFP